MRKAAIPDRLLTLEEYLAFEDRSPIKHEYVAGEVYAMSGVTLRHNLITLNLATRLRAAARSRRCRVLAADVKLQVGNDRIYYPDMMVVCGMAAEVELIVKEPSIVIEVLSPSTRAIDRREKLTAYQGVPSLDAYLVVEQRHRFVLAYLRSGGGWDRIEAVGTEGDIPLPTLGVRITLDEIYDDVPLPPLQVGENEMDGDWSDDSP